MQARDEVQVAQVEPPKLAVLESMVPRVQIVTLLERAALTVPDSWVRLRSVGWPVIADLPPQR